MSFIIKADALRAALKEIEAAEKNGFMYCHAVLKPRGIDGIFIDLNYSDLCEKAHPTDGSLNWGRCQGVTKLHKFKDGKLVPITQRKKK